MVLILNLVVVTAARYYIYTKLWGGELMRMLETVGRSVEGNPFIPVGEV